MCISKKWPFSVGSYTSRLSFSQPSCIIASKSRNRATEQIWISLLFSSPDLLSPSLTATLSSRHTACLPSSPHTKPLLSTTNQKCRKTDGTRVPVMRLTGKGSSVMEFIFCYVSFSKTSTDSLHFIHVSHSMYLELQVKCVCFHYEIWIAIILVAKKNLLYST